MTSVPPRPNRLPRGERERASHRLTSPLPNRLLRCINPYVAERITVTGNLFYASMDRLAKHLHGRPDARTVLDLHRVPLCDAAAQEMLSEVQTQRARNGGRLEIAPALFGT